MADGCKSCFESVESTFVRDFYSTNYTQFSATRVSQWPKITEFLDKCSETDYVLDAGCGNGKYMSHRCRMTGIDTCPELVAICQERGFDASVADITSIPFPDNTFDKVFSVAVIHHLSSLERRIKAVSEMLRVLKPGGQLFIQAWSTKLYESPRNLKIVSVPDVVKLDDSARLIEPEMFSENDKMVSWHNRKQEVSYRFIHFFTEAEFAFIVSHMPGITFESFHDADNVGVIITKLEG
jgi:SAM-dependent methyltransferase